jgi:quercetin dioxygenase-like cupin family protein
MGVVKQVESTPQVIAQRRTRYLAYTDNLMMAVIDFNDGPTSQPDPPHSHPHEQVSYVAAGEINFFLDNASVRLGSGDMYTVPPNMPHAIQLLSKYVRLIDSFTPIREEFLNL